MHGLKMEEKLLHRFVKRAGMTRKFLAFQGKAWRYCARLLHKNRASDVAASLSFSTIFGLVPLAVIVILVFQLMPGYEDVGDRITDFAYEQLHLSAIEYMPAEGEEPEQLTEHLDGIIQNLIEDIDTGGVTILSLGFVIVAALILLFKIERAFNNIYHVTSKRNFLQRMVNYWAVMTLGPVLIGMGIYVTTQHVAVEGLETTLFSDLGWTAMSYLMAMVTLFMLYFVLPNTSVRVRAAIWGAAVAAIAWMISKWFFGLYITHFLPYRDIYGAIGLIPLGVIWIYITWLIVLFGLQLTFTMQHLKTLDKSDVEAARQESGYFMANEMTAVGMVTEIARWFEQKRGPVGIEFICSKLDMPAELGERLAGRLVTAGILARVSEPDEGYLPGRDLRDIELSEILDVFDKAGFGHYSLSRDEELRKIRESQRSRMAQYTVDDLIHN